MIKAVARLLDFDTTKMNTTKVERTIIPKNMPKERIERMINFLTLEFLPKCKKYGENLIISQVEELCEEVAVIGEKNSVWILINWAKELHFAVENFEIIKIKQLLRNFQGIINEISLIIK